MFFDDAMTDREAKPGPFADFFGREKRIEDMSGSLGWNAWTIVTKLDHTLLLLNMRLDREPGIRAAFERVPGIRKQVNEDLLQFISIPCHHKQFLAKSQLDGNIVRLQLGVD